jgi:hypothetical protein
MMAWRWLVAGALGACALGCAESGPRESFEAERQAIVDGEPSGAEQDGVLLLRAVLADQSELVCSASLVGPSLIMTARHCVAYFTDGQFLCSVRGEPFDNPTGAGHLGLDLPADSLEVYGRKTPRKVPLARGKQVISTLSPSVCQNDLAFVVLDKALDLPIVPLRLGRPAELHEASVLVGFGMDAAEAGIDYLTQARFQKRGLEVAALGPDSIDDGVTTVPPRTLIIEGPSGCIGDSGGPLLAEKTGAALGVYSLQDGESCSAPDIRHQMVHLPPFQALIDEAFAVAGGNPTPEPELGGAAGAAGALGGSAATSPDPSGGEGGASSASTSEPEPPNQTEPSSSCAFAAPERSSTNVALPLGALAAALASRRSRSRARRRQVAA